MSALLELSGLDAAYGRSQVLHGVSLELCQGSITTVLGANGAGKTTLLRAICAMVSTRGEIRLSGRRIEGLCTEEVARLGVAHVPDSRGTFLRLSVAENLALGGCMRRDRDAVAQDRDRVLACFPRLRQRLLQQAGSLSGGEQQMLAIARALMLRPRLLLLDEPSFGLAPQLILEVFRLFRSLVESGSLGILLVEQNAALALHVADRAGVLERGRLVVAGTAAEIARDAAVRRAYLGA